MRTTALDTVLRRTSGRPVPLTLSGNEDTPASRASGTQGDGLTGPYAGSSIGVWEATTNLVTNGGFETNTTGWITGGTNTIARSTEQAKFGAASLKATYSNNARLAGWAPATGQFELLANTVYSGSMWVYIPANYDGTQLQLGFENYSTTVWTDVDMTIRDQWQRVLNQKFNTGGADNFGQFSVAENGAAPTVGRFVYIDGVQVEQQPLCTPYVHTDGGTASRTAARIRVPNPSRYVTLAQGWICVLGRYGFAAAAEPGGSVGEVLFGLSGSGASERILLYYREASNQLGLQRTGAAGADPVLALQNTSAVIGDLVCGIGRWNATRGSVSVDGAACTDDNGAELPDALTTIDIGNFLAVNHWDGEILFVAMGRGELTDANAAALNNIARNNRIDSRLEDLPGGATFKWPPSPEDWRNGITA